MTLTFNPLLAVVMTYTHAKVEGQPSVISEDRVETDGQTGTIGQQLLFLVNIFKTE